MALLKKKTAVKKSATKSSSKKEFDNTNRGVLFQNDRKEKDSHPDFKGQFTDANGNEYWLSGWQKEHDEKGEYISIAATPKEEE